MKKELQIRNSTVEFLTFVLDGKEDGVQVLYKDETIWATQKAMAVLFEVGVPAISKHLKNISDGKVYKTQYYSLDAVISVGYRVNSLRATQFRIFVISSIAQNSRIRMLQHKVQHFISICIIHVGRIGDWIY